jgi:hypothetical protein
MLSDGRRFEPPLNPSMILSAMNCCLAPEIEYRDLGNVHESARMRGRAEIYADYRTRHATKRWLIAPNKRTVNE